MYGVPADLDLNFFHAATLIQICVGVSEMIFHFHSADLGAPNNLGTISVHGGGWQLLDADGQQLDGKPEPPPAEVRPLHVLLEGGARLLEAHGANPERPPLRVHRLLGLRVVGTTVSAPRWIALTFENGDVLRILDDSEQFESFSIHPGDVFI